MDEQTDQQLEKKTVTEQLKQEMAKWQTKIDEAKVQMHLAKKEAHAKVQPHLDQLDSELKQAREKLKQLQGTSEDAWQEIHQGLKVSFKAMQQSFENAKKHFQKKEEE
jgi:hypothetical protein